MLCSLGVGLGVAQGPWSPPVIQLSTCLLTVMQQWPYCHIWSLTGRLNQCLYQASRTQTLGELGLVWRPTLANIEVSSSELGRRDLQQVAGAGTLACLLCGELSAWGMSSPSIAATYITRSDDSRYRWPMNQSPRE